MRADGRRFRVGAYSHFAGAQARFSDDDFRRARIGGIRTRVYTKNPGFATLDFRGGCRPGEHTRPTFAVENVLDENYRATGSGVHPPGTSAFVSFARNF